VILKRQLFLILGKKFWGLGPKTTAISIGFYALGGHKKTWKKFMFFERFPRTWPASWQEGEGRLRRSCE